MKDGFLQANNGAKSSKRLWGSILIGFGIEMKLFLFHLAIFLKIENFNDLDSCTNWTITVGAGLLSSGLVELFAKKNDK